MTDILIYTILGKVSTHTLLCGKIAVTTYPRMKINFEVFPLESATQSISIHCR